MSTTGILKVLVVAANASERWGGEAVLPIHIFRGLRAAGHEAWLCVGKETREELEEVLGPDARFVEYVDDTAMHRRFRWLQSHAPRWLGNQPLYFLGVFLTHLKVRRAARRLIRKHGVHLVHQPTPVSPKAPSLFFGLGVPVVIGPMNGGMKYPPGFRREDPFAVRTLRFLGRFASGIANRLLPGKPKAACLLVANERTRRSLPPASSARINRLVENGIDPALWASDGAPDDGDDRRERPLELIFLGRLEPWKGAHWLLEALSKALPAAPCRLKVVGADVLDERARLEKLAVRLGIEKHVEFLGRLPQPRCAELLRAADALVLPSIFECGGAVVLEAMATGRAVIAVDWGGPGDYLDPACGILVAPTNAATLVDDLADAIVRLANDRALCVSLGQAGRRKVLAEYTWPAKIDRLTDFYREALGREVVPGREVVGGALPLTSDAA